LCRRRGAGLSRRQAGCGRRSLGLRWRFWSRRSRRCQRVRPRRRQRGGRRRRARRRRRAGCQRQGQQEHNRDENEFHYTITRLNGSTVHVWNCPPTSHHVAGVRSGQPSAATMRCKIIARTCQPGRSIIVAQGIRNSKSQPFTILGSRQGAKAAKGRFLVFMPSWRENRELLRLAAALGSGAGRHGSQPAPFASNVARPCQVPARRWSHPAAARA
jgi:hypothetical protein